MTSTKTTTKDEWDNELRDSPAPWADFVTDKFFMQVPTSWLDHRDFDYFKDLLIKRDEAMTGVSELVGIPISERNDYLAYVQPDLHIRASAYGVGYPQINNLVSSGPNGIEADPDHWMVASPYIEDSVFWHELGHCILGLNDYYRGETEAIVNVPYAYIRQVHVGLDFDTAFAGSFNEQENFTPDYSMMHWMVTENFRDGKEMDHSNTEHDEMRYQNRGYAKCKCIHLPLTPPRGSIYTSAKQFPLPRPQMLILLASLVVGRQLPTFIYKISQISWILTSALRITLPHPITAHCNSVYPSVLISLLSFISGVFIPSMQAN